jgi:hypothetical protein
MTYPLGDPYLSLYTLEEEGYKQNSLFGTITISSTTCNLVMYALILLAELPQMVRPMYHLVVPGVNTPTTTKAYVEFIGREKARAYLQCIYYKVKPRIQRELSHTIKSRYVCVWIYGGYIWWLS